MTTAFILGTIATLLFAKAKKKQARGVGSYYHRRRVFGGNSGYSGYSMSLRAIEARNNGKFPKTDFKKEYGLSTNVFKLLNDCEIIMSYEWHHTSSWGNKTPFFEWDSENFYDIYLANKLEIGRLAIEYNKLLLNRSGILDSAARDEISLKEFHRLDREYYDKQQQIKDKIWELFRYKKGER